MNESKFSSDDNQSARPKNVTSTASFKLWPDLEAWLLTTGWRHSDHYVFPELIFARTQDSTIKHMKEHNDPIDRIPFTWAFLKRLMHLVAGIFKRPQPGPGQSAIPHSLSKGTKDSIRLLCLAPGRNGELLAYAYDGQLNPKGENHRVSFATRETDPTKAMIVAELFIDMLKKRWEDTYGD